MRTCIGCRRRAPLTELVRCALTEDGTAVLDRSAPGRGAWLCPASVACFDHARRVRRFDRAWRRAVDPAVLDALRDRYLDAAPDGSDENVRDCRAVGDPAADTDPPRKG
jgi:predicted RNA-binding protein YlxR (DUF448 family)